MRDLVIALLRYMAGNHEEALHQSRSTLHEKACGALDAFVDTYRENHQGVALGQMVDAIMTELTPPPEQPPDRRDMELWVIRQIFLVYAERLATDNFALGRLEKSRKNLRTALGYYLDARRA
jgi:hypothetical protein